MKNGPAAVGTPHRVIVVGAGISGLALAEALLASDPALEISVLESSSRAGGPIFTEATQGYRMEWGANGFLDGAPETRALVTRLGLQSRLLRSSDAARERSLWVRGRLWVLEESPPAFL